nr:hypothetical protein [Nostoc sp. DedQUE07]MDZ8133230.1 hypothetical protein [Nostoc sp. DedQUE07]
MLYLIAQPKSLSGYKLLPLDPVESLNTVALFFSNKTLPVTPTPELASGITELVIEVTEGV